ncbi:MAG: lactate utilization protein [Methanoregulaceae archaeon]|nr:lactate utilization protein [Methanoregulaceae archaeon]
MARETQFSAARLLPETKADPERWSRIPPNDVIKSTIGEIERRGVRVLFVETGDRALETLRSIIPLGSQVMNGSSTTLIEIGYDEMVASGNSGWNDLHAVVFAENDARKRAELRRKAVCADYFISGANAIAETGELLACDMTGSRTGAWLFAADHLIIVAGVNKIVPTLDDALRRIREFAYPLEDARAQHAYGIRSAIGKCAIIAREFIEGRTTVVLVNERLGY